MPAPEATAGALLDHWYVACPASLLGREPREVWLNGQAFSLWRDADGLPTTTPGGPGLAEASH